MWNGVGGKLELNESPRESIIREIEEETGLVLESVHFKGLVTWSVDGNRVGGMYTYMAELPLDYRYETPIKTDEGILDWKNIRWILNPDNKGVAYNIPRSIEKILFDYECYEHRCFYKNGELIHHESRVIDEAIENITDERMIEERIFRKVFRRRPWHQIISQFQRT